MRVICFSARVFAAGLFLLALSGSFAADFYVSPDGDDGASGTRPDVVGPDGPFAGLNRARDAVRVLRAREPERRTPITVAIRGGVYELSDPFVLTPADSGTKSSPVIYEAYSGETPVLSGGVRIRGWETGPDGRFFADVDRAVFGPRGFCQLYVNDVRRSRPVLPREGYFHIDGAVGGTEPGRQDRFRFRPEDLPVPPANPGEVEVTLFHSWSMSRLPLASADPATATVTLGGATWHPDLAALTEGTRYRLENVAEAFDEPGEWYLDRAAMRVSYIPLPGEAPDTVVARAPRLSRLIELRGDVEAGTFVDHVQFRGLTFAHTGWVPGAHGYSSFQAEVNLDGTVTARNARSCAFIDCVVRHTGNYAFDLGDGCRGVRVEGCEMVDLGAGGVKIGPGRFDDEPDKRKWASGCTVRDCLISGGGRIHPAGVGVWIGHAGDNTVENNEIRDLYQVGVSVGWRWSRGPSAATGNSVRSNHIHAIGQGVLSDLAGIYTLGESPGTVLELNRIHDISRDSYGGWGIYFDESSADIVARNNLVYRTEDAPFHLHHGRRNRVVNNIFAFGKNDQMKLTNMEKSGELVLERNIWYFREGALIRGEPDEEIVFRANLYRDESGRPLAFPGGRGATEWAAVEEGLAVADPGFADPEAGDFALPPDGPASRIGFVPFDYAAAGRIRKVSLTADLPPVPPAFPPAPPRPPLRIVQDFETIAIGHKFPGWSQMAASPEADASVTEETAASGSRSLRFTDSAEGATYFPHLFRTVSCTEGVMRASMQLRTEPGARFQFEWRDDTPWYTAGPSVECDAEGNLQSRGRQLVRIPFGQWVGITMTCGIGPDATGTWQLEVSVPGRDQPERFSDLPVAAEFKTLDWIGFCALAMEPAVFYVDDFSLGLAE